MFCSQCGASLMKGAQFCSICATPTSGQPVGYAIPYMMVPAPIPGYATRTPSVGTGPFVLGLIGLVLTIPGLLPNFIYAIIGLAGLVLGILALVLGYVARGRVKQANVEVRVGLLTSALVFGWIVVSLAVARAVILLAWFLFW